MALSDDVQNLPSTVIDGTTDHLHHHQVIHEALKNHDRRVTFQAVPERVRNLVDPDTMVSGTLSGSGVIYEHVSNRTTDYIPVVADVDYVSMSDTGSHRVVWFDKDKVAISGTDTERQTPGTPVVWVSPTNAAYVRIGFTLGSSASNVGIRDIFNRGDTLVPTGAIVNSGWWDDRELPPQPVVEGAVPAREGNLFDIEDSALGTLSTNGTVTDHTSNRTSGFIPVVGGEEYVSYHMSLSRIVWYDAFQNAIAGTNTDYVDADTVYNWVAPSNAAYVRMTMVLTLNDNTTPPMIFNKGDTLVPTGAIVNSGWWDDRELPPIAAIEGLVPAREGNLFDIEDTVLGTLSATSGNVNAHASNLTSGFIPVVGGEDYVSHYTSLTRIVWFDASKAIITGTNTDYTVADTVYNWVAPSNAAYVRMTMVLQTTDTNIQPMIFNRGDILLPPGAGLDSGWWDDRELPPGVSGGIDPDELTALIRAEVDKAIPHYEPSFPTLNFTSIYEGYDEPLWLSSDGVMLYGHRGHILTQSDDEWATQQDIVTFDTLSSVSAIRSLDNGELLVAQGRNVSEGRKARLMLSSGYNRSNPTAATWSQVLEAGSVEANINNSWGLQTYQNVVIAGEYGLWGEDGARHVWISEDYGATFRLVFDFKTDVPEGGPEWSDKAHIHTAAWDPYWSRIWIACGDNPSTATYYSDDKGVTWHYVEGTGYGGGAVQYTGILALPDVVLFGSDRAPNGVHTYRRGEKTDMPVINPMFLVDDENVITRVFQLPYKRDWSPTTETYFAASNAGGRGRSIIVGTVDGKKANLMWESEDPAGGEAFSGNVHFAFGPTAQGNIVTRMSSDPTLTGIRVMKAPAPTWARV